MPFTETYLLILVIRSANDFSQAYILMILMPVITSFIVLILTSVKVAVLLLRGTGGRDELALHNRRRHDPPSIDGLQLLC